jgi:hypothetical protein
LVRRHFFSGLALRPGRESPGRRGRRSAAAVEPAPQRIENAQKSDSVGVGAHPRFTVPRRGSHLSGRNMLNFVDVSHPILSMFRILVSVVLFIGMLALIDHTLTGGDNLHEVSRLVARALT